MTHSLLSDTPENLEKLKSERILLMVNQEIDFFEKSVTALATVSQEYNNRIVTAKTQIKKKMYTKKLKKNNNTLGGLLVELEKAIAMRTRIEQTLSDNAGSST